MNDRIFTTKQSTTKPCAYFLGYTVYIELWQYTGFCRTGKARDKDNHDGEQTWELSDAS